MGLPKKRKREEFKDGGNHHLEKQKVKLKPLSIQDISAASSIEEQTFDSADRWNIQTWESVLKNKQYFGFKITSERFETLGFILAKNVTLTCNTVEELEQKDQWCRQDFKGCVRKVICVENIAVLPAERGLGLGRILLNHILKLCDEPEWICLEVNAENKPAVNLYESTGFRVTRILKGYYSSQGGSDALKMVLYHEPVHWKKEQKVLKEEKLKFENLLKRQQNENRVMKNMIRIEEEEKKDFSSTSACSSPTLNKINNNIVQCHSHILSPKINRSVTVQQNKKNNIHPPVSNSPFSISSHINNPFIPLPPPPPKIKLEPTTKTTKVKKKPRKRRIRKTFTVYRKCSNFSNNSTTTRRAGISSIANTAAMIMNFNNQHNSANFKNIEKEQYHICNKKLKISPEKIDICLGNEMYSKNCDMPKLEKAEEFPDLTQPQNHIQKQQEQFMKSAMHHQQLKFDNEKPRIPPPSTQPSSSSVNPFSPFAFSAQRYSHIQFQRHTTAFAKLVSYFSENPHLLNRIDPSKFFCPTSGALRFPPPFLPAPSPSSQNQIIKTETMNSSTTNTPSTTSSDSDESYLNQSPTPRPSFSPPVSLNNMSPDFNYMNNRNFFQKQPSPRSSYFPSPVTSTLPTNPYLFPPVSTSSTSNFHASHFNKMSAPPLPTAQYRVYHQRAASGSAGNYHQQLNHYFQPKLQRMCTERNESSPEPVVLVDFLKSDSESEEEKETVTKEPTNVEEERSLDFNFTDSPFVPESEQLIKT